MNVANALQPLALYQLFRLARTYNEWRGRSVDEPVVRALYDLMLPMLSGSIDSIIRVGAAGNVHRGKYSFSKMGQGI